MLRITLLLISVLLLACESSGTRKETGTYTPSPTEAGFPEQASVFCPNDYAITPNKKASKAYTTSAACEAARAADTCTGAAIGRTNAACNTYCATNWWSCVGSVINGQEVTGNACYEDPTSNTTNYHYMCMGTADCHCL